MSKRRKKRRGRTLRWILGSTFVVLIACVVAVYAVLANLDVEEIRPVVEQQSEELTGRKLTVAGDIDLEISLTPKVALGNVSFANAEWGSRPNMVHVERMTAQVDLLPLLSGEIAIDHVTLVEPDILLETDSEGQGNWVLSPEAPGTSESSASVDSEEIPRIKDIRIENAQIVYRDGQTKAEHSVLINKAVLRAESPDSPMSLDLAFQYQGMPIAASGTLGSVQALRKGPYDYDLKVSAGSVEGTVKGSVAKPLAAQGIAGQVVLTAQSLAGLGDLIQADLPELGPARFASQFKLSDDMQNVDLSSLDATLANSDLKGALTIALAGAVPKATGDLSSNRLDLAEIAAAFSSGEGPSQSASTSKYVFTEDPLPFDVLKSADAKLDYAAKLVKLPSGIAAQDLKLALNLNGGHLILNPVNTKIADGDVALDLDVNGGVASPTVKTNIRVRGLQYGEILKSLAIDDGFQGPVDADVFLSGHGMSQRAIVSTLNGSVGLVNNGGTYRGGGPMTAFVTGLTDILKPFGQQSGDIQVNCMVLRHEFKDGLATAKALLIDWQPVILYGGGSADFRTETLDYKVESETRDVSLTSLAVPFRITGTFADPGATLDPLGTIEGVAKIAATIVVPVYGIAALVADSQLSSGGNRCVEAVENPQAGASSEPKSTVEKAAEGVGDAAEGVGDAIENVGEGISKGIKNLFGD